MKIIAAKFGGKGKLLDPAKFQAAANKALDKVAKDVQSDYKSTWRTFKRVRPTADITAPKQGQRDIRVKDKIYELLDVKGSRPHIIRPRRAKRLAFRSGFVSKTIPGFVGSRPGGSSGGRIFAKRVKHPGFKPRYFTLAIYEKRKFDLQKELDKALKGL